MSDPLSGFNLDHYTMPYDAAPDTPPPVPPGIEANCPICHTRLCGCGTTPNPAPHCHGCGQAIMAEITDAPTTPGTPALPPEIEELLDTVETLIASRVREQERDERFCHPDTGWDTPTRRCDINTAHDALLAALSAQSAAHAAQSAAHAAQVGAMREAARNTALDFVIHFAELHSGGCERCLTAGAIADAIIALPLPDAEAALAKVRAEAVRRAVEGMGDEAVAGLFGLPWPKRYVSYSEARTALLVALGVVPNPPEGPAT